MTSSCGPVIDEPGRNEKWLNLSAPADGQTTPTFVDKAVADAFRDYYHNQAMLRILSKSADLQTASQARRPKIARPVRLA